MAKQYAGKSPVAGLALLITLTSSLLCTNRPPHEVVISPQVAPAESPSVATSSAAKPSLDFLDKAETNHRVKNWIERFTADTDDLGSFSSLLKRGERYRGMIETVLKSHGVPPEFYYLPLIESGYLNHARSGRLAVGMWQLVPSTGEEYGLLLSENRDDRKDALRSTHAAAKYLHDLYGRFRAWDVALAAYNAGENRVRLALKRSGHRDLWRLIETGRLPAETRQFVPKFVAAVVIGEDPERYGVEIPATMN